MATPDARLQLQRARLRIMGTIPGFVPDAQRVQDAYMETTPDVVALGVPPEDLEGLDVLAKEPDPLAVLPEISEHEERFFDLLAPFGGTRVPSPDLEVVHSMARRDGVELAAIDMDDEEHTRIYLRHVKFRHVLRAGRGHKRLLVMPFSASDAYDLATQWDRKQNNLKPLRRFEALREERMAKQLGTLAKDHGSILCIVHAARFAGVVEHLKV